MLLTNIPSNGNYLLHRIFHFANKTKYIFNYIKINLFTNLISGVVANIAQFVSNYSPEATSEMIIVCYNKNKNKKQTTTQDLTEKFCLLPCRGH